MSSGELLKQTVNFDGWHPAAPLALNWVGGVSCSRWARFRRRGVRLGEYEGPKLAHKLEIGGDFVIQITQRPEFNNWISSGNLWCAVKHSVSTRPVLAKVFVGRK